MVLFQASSNIGKCVLFLACHKSKNSFESQQEVAYDIAYDLLMRFIVQFLQDLQEMPQAVDFKFNLVRKCSLATNIKFQYQADTKKPQNLIKILIKNEKFTTLL